MPAGKPSPPTVTATPMQLVRYPNMNQLGAYCPAVITDRIARLGCTVALGPPPPQDQLLCSSSERRSRCNPITSRFPALDVAAGAEAVHRAGGGGLGASVHQHVRGAGPKLHRSARPAHGMAGGPGIRTLNDFVAAVPGLIAGLATGPYRMSCASRRSRRAAM